MLRNLLCMICVSAPIGFAQPALPSPHGRFAVGRRAFFWTDPSRAEDTGRGPQPRGIAASVFYPAIANGHIAPYYPGLAGLTSAPETAVLRLQFGEAWQAVVKGQIRGHSSTDAPLAKDRARFPLLIFSPDAAAPARAYTIQLEELASQGYVVAALDHGTDSPLIITPDGTLIPFVRSGTVDEGPPTQAGIEAGRDEVARWTADTAFALDQIAGLARQQPDFWGQMDLTRIGVFGHSEGGKAAVRICQTDARVRACLNQDGEMFNIPFGASEPIPAVLPGQSTKAPVAVMYAAEPGFTDAQLAAAKATRQQFEGWREAKNRALRSFLKANSGGSYLITIKRAGFVHASFMDIRQLGPKPNPQATDNLILAVAYTFAFFDAELRNERQRWNALAGKPPEGILVEALSAQKRK